MKLEDALKAHKRIAIVGAPGTGKSTLAALRSDAVETCDFQRYGWRMSGIKALQSVAKKDAYVVVGVTAIHAVRLAPDAFDAVIVMQTPKHERYQDHIAAGIRTILDDIKVKKIYELNCEG